MLRFIFLLIISSAGEVTYTFNEVLHARSVTETLKETEGSSGDAQRLLFGDVIIKNDSVDVAWVASAPDMLVLGVNDQIGINGPGNVGRVFGKTDRTSVLRLIEFGAQGLVVNDDGNINGVVEWRCPYVTAVHRVCQDVETKSSPSGPELERLLDFADRGQAYAKFEGFTFGGRFIGRQHILPTQINKSGQVAFIDPLGKFPNAIFIATPVLVGMKAASLLAGATMMVGTSLPRHEVGPHSVMRDWYKKVAGR
jgi:hypothetical protein